MLWMSRDFLGSERCHPCVIPPPEVVRTRKSEEYHGFDARVLRFNSGHHVLPDLFHSSVHWPQRSPATSGYIAHFRLRWIHFNMISANELFRLVLALITATASASATGSAIAEGAVPNQMQSGRSGSSNREFQVNFPQPKQLSRRGFHVATRRRLPPGVDVDQRPVIER